MSLLAAASRLLRLLAPRPRAANRAGAVNPNAPASSRVTRIFVFVGTLRVEPASSWPRPRRRPPPLPPENDDASGETYDEQLAIVRALKSSGAGSERMRVATARLAELKREGWVPRYTPSRKFAMNTTAAEVPRVPTQLCTSTNKDGNGKQKRNAARRGGPTVTCPTCGQDVKATHPDQFRTHVHKCAPDAVAAVTKEQWRDVTAAAAAVETYELALLEDAKRLSYRDGLTREEVARTLGVSTDRVRQTLRRDSRATPLVADDAPLDVIHEDEDLLVVNKPPGYGSTRCTGSRVTRCSRAPSGTSGAEVTKMMTKMTKMNQNDQNDRDEVPTPHVIHRLDMDTSGVCVLVKRPELVDGFARQFRGDAGEYRARKEYLAIGVGDVPTGSTVAYEQTGVDTNETATTHDDAASTPEFTEFTVDAHIGPHASIPEARAIHPPPPEPVQKRPASHPGADPDAPKPARTDVQIVSSARMTITTDGGERRRGRGRDDGGQDGGAGEGDATHRPDASDSSAHVARQLAGALGPAVRTARPLGSRGAVRGRVDERRDAGGGEQRDMGRGVVARKAGAARAEAHAEAPGDRDGDDVRGGDAGGYARRVRGAGTGPGRGVGY